MSIEKNGHPFVWGLVAFAFVGATAAWAAPDNKDVLAKQVAAEVSDRTFITKINFGNAVFTRATRYFHLLDTEVQPGGSTRFQMRFTGFDQQLLSNRYSDTDSARVYSVPAGSSVRVVKIESKDDRLELFLATVPSGAYAKLKLMLGKDWDRKYDLDAILMLAAYALKIDRFEQRYVLEERYAKLTQSLAKARDEAAASTTGVDRLERNEALHASLDEAVRNREQLAALTKKPAAGADALKTEFRLVADRLPQLRSAAAAERVANAKAALESLTNEGGDLRRRATSGGKTLADWQARHDAATRWVTNVRKRQEVLRTLSSLDVGTVEEAPLAAELRTAEAQIASLDMERAQIQLTELRAVYTSMRQKRLQLIDAYTRAYGTGQQRPAAQQLLVHLQRMYENRMAAAKLGDAKATAEAATLQREIERLRRQ